MHKLMCRFVATTKEIPDLNLDTSYPTGIPCKKEKKYFALGSRANVRYLYVLLCCVYLVEW